MRCEQTPARLPRQPENHAAALTEEAEALFQAVRAGLEYKRKDISLTVSAPIATLAAKDFQLEILYALIVHSR